MKIQRLMCLRKRLLVSYTSLLVCMTPLIAAAEYSTRSGEITSPDNSHIEIADINFSNGNVVKFILTPETKEIYSSFAKMHPKLPEFLSKAIKIYGENLSE